MQETSRSDDVRLFYLDRSNLPVLLLGLALDLAGRLLAHHVTLPLRLDCIGTLFVAISLGPFFGAFSGAAGAIFGSLLFHLSPWYIMICACTGFFAGLPFIGERRKNAFTILTTGLIAGAVASLFTGPILLRYFDSYTDNVWGNALVNMLGRNIQAQPFCCIIGELFVDFPDKMLATVLAGLLWLRLHRPAAKRRPRAQKRMRISALLAAALAGTLFLAAHPMRTSAEAPDYRASYESILYNEENGLLSVESNAVAQTSDGYLWVGTYSGLYRYDGFDFEAMELDKRINNVMQLFNDSKGRLWIGTNDSGIACYDPATERVDFYTMSDGLAADAIRSICEDADGNIYVGTVSAPSVILTDGTVVTDDAWEVLDNTRTLTADEGGRVCGVTHNGTLFVMEGGRLVCTAKFASENTYYTAVGAYGDGRFLVGMSDARAEIMEYADGKFSSAGFVETGGFSYFNKLLRTDGGFFFCAENGPGFLADDGTVTDLGREGFQSAMSDVTIDMQGNIWFSSAKHGVLKYSQNPFFNLSRSAGLPDTVVNAILIRGDELLVGSDDGLFVLDRISGKPVEASYADKLRGDRIRHMMLDSAGNTWVSTYSQHGLVCIDDAGNVTTYTESDGTRGGRFRSAIELADGRILAASSDGLTWIRDGRVEKTLGEAEGLRTTQILSMVERSDGSILAASDGDGVYVIEDDAIVDNIGADDGLSTLVVLRIVPHERGTFFVTSNALYYDDGVAVRLLDQFPYSNNYDIHFDEAGMAWISSSAGIYLVNVNDLIANSPGYRYTLLNRTRGLYTSLTANAWNAVKDDMLYLCCSDGLRSISTRTYDSYASDYQIRINAITGDDTHVPVSGNTYVIPRDARRVRFDIAVLNFTLSNPLLHIYLDGADDNGITCRQSELTPLSYTHLPHGTYELHVQVLDDATEAVERDVSFLIRKDAELFERTGFRTYLFIVCAAFALILAWLFSKVNDMAIINRQYDQIRAARDEADEANQAKSRFLAHVSHEIRTPINMITGMNELILRGQTTQIVRERALGIKHASDALLSIVNDILDLSKIESGKFMIQPQDYDMAQLLQSVITMTQLRCEKANLSFDYEVDPKLPARLFGDDVRIKQILMNLLTNAVKYTEKGGVTLRVRLADRVDQRARIRFEVADTGVGIRKKDLNRLFEAFERLDEPVTRNTQGTGLGLNISEHLAELMGSHIECESTYGVGSLFSFDLDQHIIRDVAIGEKWLERAGDVEADSVPARHFTAEQARILIIDDNDLNLHVAKGLLARSKCAVVTADGGARALEILGIDSFDLILLDHMMPDMDGIQTLHEIRAHGIGTPVVALTANAIEGAREQYLAEGFSDYLPKPIDPDHLDEILLSLLPPDLITFAEPTPEEVEEADEAAATDAFRPLVLVADDDELICHMASQILGTTYRVRTCLNGADLIPLIRGEIPSLVLLDINMPDPDGFAILSELKKDKALQSVPVIFMTSDEDRDTEIRGFQMGVSDFVRKPFLPEILLQRAKRIIELSHLQRFLQDEVARQTDRSEHLTREIMLALSDAVDAKDHYTNGHSVRVAKYATRIAARLGLSRREQEDIYSMGLMHDIGKIGVSEAIINKSTRLTQEEFDEIRSHTTIGFEILKNITELPGLATGARWHHERYDGNGYPDGLRGTEIPLEARIICVADAYDAMTSNRSYSNVREQNVVREEILRCRGKQFDPEIADILIQMIDEDPDYMMSER